MIANVFLTTGLAAVAVGWLHIFRGSERRRIYGWFAVANGLMVVSDALSGDRVAGGVAAGFCAYSAWLWWRSGGGTGIKRRIRSWARRFRGVRRTAPVAGAA